MCVCAATKLKIHRSIPVWNIVTLSTSGINPKSGLRLLFIQLLCQIFHILHRFSAGLLNLFPSSNFMENSITTSFPSHHNAHIAAACLTLTLLDTTNNVLSCLIWQLLPLFLAFLCSTNSFLPRKRTWTFYTLYGPQFTGFATSDAQFFLVHASRCYDWDLLKVSLRWTDEINLWDDFPFVYFLVTMSATQFKIYSNFSSQKIELHNIALVCWNLCSSRTELRSK